ncbi:hypothetical protein GHT06_017185 [Daphnia sinensis]|uniref:Uncharacterized protein n=1 Tax=Daphnia sinensis TaxID=1820382 RepID=A0AAD5PS20_9CRUS|nr:hypothetical protein GHT06_017185 [Daphnia sinensis]
MSRTKDNRDEKESVIHLLYFLFRLLYGKKQLTVLKDLLRYSELSTTWSNSLTRNRLTVDMSMSYRPVKSALSFFGNPV